MQIIANANETTLTLLKRFYKTDSCSRLFHYCVQTPVEEGSLLFNLLTREALLLSPEEYADLYQLDYLKEHWFVVPEDAKDKEYADFVMWVLTTRQEKSKEITSYTIFPTTDCNARCFYCFELGRSRIPMTHETALKVVDYIKAHCGEKMVNISWFGGEPLFNMEAIETICDGLRREKIEFKSTMVSNGYLFDAQTVKKAVEQWNLKRVQITLDGTEQIYNKAKAFIYREGNPYQVVLENMKRLLDASVAISVRLNMDLYNAEDLLRLIDDLAQRFGGRKGIRVYAHHLFKGNLSMADMHSDEEWEKRDVAMHQLEEKIQQNGFSIEQGISKSIRLNHCMADNGKSVTILPDGNIGLCEHFSESEFIGHIDREGFDAAMVESWKERMPEIPECAECFYYPECIKLKKCANANVCFRQFRQEQLRKTQQRMACQYENWKNKNNSEDEEDVGTC